MIYFLLPANKVWLAVVMILLISGMTLQAFAVVAPSWLQVRCQRGALTVGLWTMCGDPLSNISWPRMVEKGTYGYRGNSTSATKLESMKRSVERGGLAELSSGGGGEERVKVNTTRWLLFWDNCLEMVTDDEHPHPGIFLIQFLSIYPDTFGIKSKMQCPHIGWSPLALRCITIP